MAIAYVSRVLDFDIDTVWEVLHDFHDLAAWVDRIRESVPENGEGPGAVGSIRRLTLTPDDHVTRERLVRYDAGARSYSYEFADEIRFPVRTYRGTVHVLPVTDTASTFIEWYGEYDADPGKYEEVGSTFRAIYTDFIGQLCGHLESLKVDDAVV